MKFSAPQILADRKIDDGNIKNVVTIGIGSYVGGSEISWGMESIGNVLIGRYCSFGGGISFSMGANHIHRNTVTTYPFDSGVISNVFKYQWKAYPHELLHKLRHKQPNNHYQIIIGHDVWIGEGARVLGGVKIGSGAIIGGHALVAKDIPPYAVAVGNPARVVKYRFPPDVIKKFMAIKWWNWHLDKITENIPLMYNVDEFLDKHYSPEITDITKNVTGGG